MNVVNSMSWKPVIPQIDPVGSLTVCESLDAEAALKCQWTIKVTQGESFDDLFRLSAPSEHRLLGDAEPPHRVLQVDRLDPDTHRRLCGPRTRIVESHH